MSNDGVPAPLDGVAVAEGYRAAAARRGGGGRGGFPDLRNNRRFRTALYYVVWGGAGIISMSTNVPSISVNPDHLMLNIVFITAGAILLLLSMAADDMPWMEPAAARLEGLLARMINLGDQKLRTLLARGAAGLPIPIAARRGGGFHDLRNRRSRIGFYYAFWGLAGIMSTTVAILSVNTTVPILSVNTTVPILSVNNTVPILSVNTTVPSLPVNPDHIMLYSLLLIAGVMLLLLTMAAADLPWMEGAAARLESLLAAMIKIEF